MPAGKTQLLKALKSAVQHLDKAQEELEYLTKVTSARDFNDRLMKSLETEDREELDKLAFDDSVSTMNAFVNQMMHMTASLLGDIKSSLENCEQEAEALDKARSKAD